MSTSDLTPREPVGGNLEVLAKQLQEIRDGGDAFVGVFAKGENFRHIRHEQALARWEVLDEPWAQGIEATRRALHDRTPGAASFGR